MAEEDRAVGGGAVRLEVSQQPYLSAAPGPERLMSAVVTVTVGSDAVPRSAPDKAEVFVLDCSASMGHPREKLWAAQDAALAAVAALPEGTRFAVVAGRGSAEPVYPPPSEVPSLARVSGESRQAAEEAVRRLSPRGGTAIGSWLALARELLATAPDTLGHTLLLSDGRNEHESRQALEAELAACTGRFTCDARGIGEDWDPDELQLIADRLHGEADRVRDLTALAAELRAVTEESSARLLDGLRLRITHRTGCAPRTVEQVHPVRRDLLAQGEAAGERCLEFPTAPWGAETRDYLVSLPVSHRPEEPLDVGLWLAEVKLVAEPGAGAFPALPPARPVLVQWTNRRDLYSRYDAKVVHYCHHDDLARELDEGRSAHAAGDLARARQAWGRAVRLAHQLRDERMLRRLADVVEIVDAGRGEVEIRADIKPLDIKSAVVLRAHTTLPPSLSRGGEEE